MNHVHVPPNALEVGRDIARVYFNASVLQETGIIAAMRQFWQTHGSQSPLFSAFDIPSLACPKRP